MLIKPSSNDYPEYYNKYINSLPESGILEIYKSQTDEILKFYNELTSEKLLYKYAPDKWSIIEILGHLIDSEIIMNFRALTYARNDRTNLPMYDHDKYMANANFNNLDSGLMLNLYASVRKSNLLLFNSFTKENWNSRGITGNKEFTTSSIPYIIVGHTQHHINVIKEKYL